MQRWVLFHLVTGVYHLNLVKDIERFRDTQHNLNMNMWKILEGYPWPSSSNEPKASQFFRWMGNQNSGIFVKKRDVTQRPSHLRMTRKHLLETIKHKTVMHMQSASFDANKNQQHFSINLHSGFFFGEMLVGGNLGSINSLSQNNQNWTFVFPPPFLGRSGGFSFPFVGPSRKVCFQVGPEVLRSRVQWVFRRGNWNHCLPGWAESGSRVGFPRSRPHSPTPQTNGVKDIFSTPTCFFCKMGMCQVSR